MNGNIHLEQENKLQLFETQKFQVELPDFRLYYKATVIKRYGTGTKTEIYINGTEQKAQKEIHEPMDTLSSTKEARIYNGKKTTSLTSGDGKTGQPLVKE